VSAPMSDLDTAECCLLNASLRLKRGRAGDEFTAEEYAAIRKHLDAAAAHLRLARVAIDPPALVALANEGPSW
jgi:hypothetical protein